MAWSTDGSYKFPFQNCNLVPNIYDSQRTKGNQTVKIPRGMPGSVYRRDYHHVREYTRKTGPFDARDSLHFLTIPYESRVRLFTNATITKSAATASVILLSGPSCHSCFTTLSETVQHLQPIFASLHSVKGSSVELCLVLFEIFGHPDRRERQDRRMAKSTVIFLLILIRQHFLVVLRT